MVLSTNNCETSDCEKDSCSGRLLHDIEEISKALYLDKSPSKLLRPTSQLPSWSLVNNVVHNALEKDKKSSIWKRKTLKVLNHFRNDRFKCCFFLHVHAIDGLPSSLNDIVLCVNWKRKDEFLRTRPVRVFQGLAEFKETLMYRCTVYGSRNGPQSSAKYKPKLSLLHASIIGAPGLDMGKHRVDLTRLLPLTLDELEKRTSGKWTTSFKLKGKAKGAILSVSFGFSTSGENPFCTNHLAEVSDIREGSVLTNLDHFAQFGETGINTNLHRFGSLPIESNNRFHHLPSRSIDLKFTNKVNLNGKFELPTQLTLLCEKLDEKKPGNSKELELSDGHKELLDSVSVASSDCLSGETETRLDDVDFVVVDKGVELSVKDELKHHDSCQSFSGFVIDATEITGNLPEESMNCNENNVSSTEQKHFNVDSCESAVGNDKKNVDFQDEESSFRGAATDSPEILATEVALDTDNKKDAFQDEESNFGDPRVVPPDISASESALDTDEKKDDFQDEAADAEDPPAILPDKLLSDSAELDFLLHTSSFIEHEDSIHPQRNDIAGRLVRSLSMDDVTESVANEFLGIFTEQVPGDTSSESDPESPRERLLKQFEKECPEFGDAILFSNTGAKDTEFSIGDFTNKGRVPSSDDCDWTLVIREAEKEHNRVMQSLKSRRNAKMLENLETETLMQRWGLNEKAFQHSPRIASGGFGSPIYIPHEEPSELPPLAEGLGPIIRTRKGGILRSMSTSLFTNAKNGAKLVLQVSIPTVLPAAMGSSVVEILQGWASVGSESLLNEANELMPLEDITGKTLQQVMLEAESSLRERCTVLDESSDIDHSSVNGEETRILESHSISLVSALDEESLDYVSFGDLVPLVMASVEALSIEGLKIQSGLSNEEAPCHIRANFTGNWSSTGWNGEHGEGGMTRQILDVKDDNDVDVDDIIKLSMSLDHWLKLDAGDIAYEHVDKQMLKTLAAHHANFHVLRNLQLPSNGEQAMPSSSNSGLLTYSFTLALRLQLRDPFRDYEMVGGSLLALAQVERVCVPLGKEVCNMVSESQHPFQNRTKRNTNWVPKFKISEVHVAGLKVDIDDKQILTTRRQLQAGSRWLLSNGMISKGKHHRFSNSNAIVKSSSQLLKKSPGDILWSVLAPVQSPTANIRSLNVHFRNPDIVFPNDSIRFLKG